MKSSWALEKAMRMRLKDELAASASSAQPSPPVAHTMVADEQGYEVDKADQQQFSRHLLGRSEHSPCLYLWKEARCPCLLLTAPPSF